MKHSLLLSLSLIAAGTCWAPEDKQCAQERQKCQMIAICAGKVGLKLDDEFYHVPANHWFILTNPKPAAN